MGEVILAVDDSPSVRQMVCSTLRSAEYQVIEAANGTEAMSRLSCTIHLIITDLKMPGMDGIELIKQVRSSPSHKHVPVLVLTTGSQPARNQEARSAGATGWIIKPFIPEQLLAIVARVLALHGTAVDMAVLS